MGSWRGHMWEGNVHKRRLTGSQGPSGCEHRARKGKRKLPGRDLWEMGPKSRMGGVLGPCGPQSRCGLTPGVGSASEGFEARE